MQIPTYKFLGPERPKKDDFKDGEGINWLRKKNNSGLGLKWVHSLEP